MTTERWRRLLALILKELRQIRHNRRLIISLLIPPTLQIVVFGFALNPTVNHLRLGVVDESRTPASRALVDAFTANATFVITMRPDSSRTLSVAMDRGELDGGLVIPVDYERQLSMPQRAHVQLIFNAINANTATIAQGYSQAILQAFNEAQPVLATYQATPLPTPTPTPGAAQTVPEPSDTSSPPRPVAITSQVALLYNPGLVSAWFIVTGTFGVLLTLNGSLVAAATTIREKDTGTLEQLLMTPAETSEIIVAKMSPLFLLLLMDVCLVLIVTHTVFGVPIRGSLLLIVTAGALCALVGIAIGTLIGTVAQTTLQAQLISFFVNPPLSMLSGSTTPVEAMPAWLQPWTWLNPIRHFSIIARGILIKGVGMEVLYPNFLALAAFALILTSISVRRYRRQLG